MVTVPLNLTKVASSEESAVPYVIYFFLKFHHSKYFIPVRIVVTLEPIQGQRVNATYKAADLNSTLFCV